MTEQEAKQKWCPMVRGVNTSEGCVEPHQSAHNMEFSGERIVSKTNCIASACMMWRWSDRPTKDENGAHYKSMVDGHCGLVNP